MISDHLRQLQSPLKHQYRESLEVAMRTLHARGKLDVANVTCKIETGMGKVEAGLHPATGSDGTAACS